MERIFRLALVRIPDFRRLCASVLFNAVGMMGETVVLGWLTLELTNSPLLVGVAMSMRMLPLFFVGVPAGALADRVPRHRMLMLTGAGQALTAGTLGVLTMLGQVTLAHVLLLTLAAGTLRGRATPTTSSAPPRCCPASPCSASRCARAGSWARSAPAPSSRDSARAPPIW